MIKQLYTVTLTLILILVAGQASAETVQQAPIGEAVERHLTGDVPFMQWVKDPDRISAEMGDTIEMRETIDNPLETIKLSNLVPPVRFESGVANIPDSTMLSLREILDRMKDRINVRLNLLGHADNRPLSPRLAEIYGDNAGLSKERAGKVAEHFQTSLGLPAEAISYEWAGDEQPIASNMTEQGRAVNRRVEVEVWYDEVRDELALEEFLVPHQFKQVKVCRMETMCKLRYIQGHSRRARVQNLIAPLHYSEDAIDVREHFIEQIRRGLDNLRDRQNVVVRFVGYTDDVELLGRTERIYGTHIGLSKARARRVALAVQDSLDLQTSMVESDGQGARRPIGSNKTVRGRALNRRVEVEFWYDDPLQRLPDEPQLCPGSPGALMVTKTYEPTWGSISHVAFSEGQPVVPSGYISLLARALEEVSDKTNPRLRFIGYTRNERLARRTATIYEDDIGLSASRARRAMEALAGDAVLSEAQMEFEGHGYVHSRDVVNAGFTQGETSHVAVEVVYDELAVLDDYEGIDITRVTRELGPQNPLALNLMRITVDGVPIDDPQRSSADIQRCTDVAMQKQDIQFGFDNLRSAPRLSVSANPTRIPFSRTEEETIASRVGFRMYTNYSHFIDHAEIRVFGTSQSLESTPLDVVEIGVDGISAWQPPEALLKGPVQELAYVLRAYGEDGNFDETRPQPLWVFYDEVEAIERAKTAAAFETDQGLYASYGENALSVHNIGLSSGSVTVRGSAAGKEVYVAGRPVPVDDEGRFVTEEILPQGLHTVEVALMDEEGSGNIYLRDLELRNNDWFYVGMADLTFSQSESSGSVDLLQAGDSPFADSSNVDGRVAFFINGKFGDHWKLTTSADTGEGSLEDIFTNFMDKSPESLFRRMDPDYHYPVFGDESTVAEMAPTMGKFFVRLSERDNYGQWGNFRVGYMNNELAHVSRGLYGANIHYESHATTAFGDQRYAVDTFAAAPGTVSSHEEFRGTGGSLYFLNRQDILAGSERVRVEVRDKTSGIVMGVVNLTQVVDYDVDYIQGRIVLSEPLSSSVDDGLLVRSDTLGGDEAYLVVQYEYSPGFEEIDALSVGGQAHVWIGEHVKLGLTSNSNDQDDENSGLHAADVTLRLAAQSWMKLQHAKSDGLTAIAHRSDDGGYNFGGYDPSSFANVGAAASRIDLSLSSNDIMESGNSILTVYIQDVEAGYSAPGLATISDTSNYGGTFTMPIGKAFSLGAKVDSRVQEHGLETQAQEVNLTYRMDERWDVSAGYRADDRVDQSASVALTQEQGQRTDAVIQVGYDSGTTWRTYGFLQDTVSVSGNRRENAHAGAGGSYRVTDRLGVDLELSNGDQGTGGRVGTNYMHSDRTSMYLNYVVAGEHSATGSPAIPGSEGNLVAGFKTRLADSTSVFLEERYQHSDAMAGLTHSTGITFMASDRLRFGLTSDIGTLQHIQTGAETERLAGSIRVDVAFDALQFSSSIEYRDDDAEQADLSRTERTTWLFKNTFKYESSENARFVGKLNHSVSESSLGTFFEGGFTEAVLGYAFRPIDNDRLNALVKYTYFNNVPTTGQLTLQNVAAEFIQKSHIAAVDITYDITPAFTIGGKYAYRLGQVSLDRENPEFFDNNANLYVVRGDYRLGRRWEGLVEGRMLDMPDLEESRVGILVMVSRYFGDNLKAGVGYNFTDFSDDLTQLGFDHHGVFLNLTGSM